MSHLLSRCDRDTGRRDQDKLRPHREERSDGDCLCHSGLWFPFTAHPSPQGQTGSGPPDECPSVADTFLSGKSAAVNLPSRSWELPRLGCLLLSDTCPQDESSSLLSPLLSPPCVLCLTIPVYCWLHGSKGLRFFFVYQVGTRHQSQTPHWPVARSKRTERPRAH